MQLFQPTSGQSYASAFVTIMTEIWEPLHGWEVYDLYHDANTTAAKCHATKLYPFIRDGAAGHQFKFPDGSLVWINLDGNGCAEMLPQESETEAEA